MLIKICYKDLCLNFLRMYCNVSVNQAPDKAEFRKRRDIKISTSQTLKLICVKSSQSVHTEKCMGRICFSLTPSQNRSSFWATIFNNV